MNGFDPHGLIHVKCEFLGVVHAELALFINK